MTTENLKFQQVAFQLFRDAEGFWGWTVGTHTMSASFTSRIIALQTAQKHIRQTK